jgi:hypothetical protein
LDAREKEQYLREYYILKSKGKPFFPYAVFKDGAMALIVMIVIVLMSIFLGAELGPKADPTSTTYVPRPEWYYFFLFELLRVVKPPALVFIATVGIPTLAMVLLVLLPFIDRNRRDCVPHDPRRDRRVADRDRHEGGAAVREGQGSRGLLRLPRLSQDRRERQRRARATTDKDRLAPRSSGDRADADQPDSADAAVHCAAAERPGEVQRDGRIPVEPEVERRA